MPARFFLSYAKADEDGYVTRFFDDLVLEVQRQSGVSGDEPGFQDFSSMRVGASWARELFEALNTSQTFLALCSPSYFASEFCGQEWTMFAARAERYRKAHGSVPPTLLPVVWVPAPDVPEVARQLQYTDPAFGKAYAREGLYHLLRLRRYREDYLIFLRALAQRVLEVARAHPLPPFDGGHSVTDVESAFHGPRATRPLNRSTSGAPPVPRWSTGAPDGAMLPAARVRRPGPQHVYFVIVAAPARELAGIRDELRHYGQEPFDWAPYRPRQDQRISVFAQSVAADQDLSSRLAEAHEVVDVLERAGGRNELVVLLVDVWTTRIEAYREHMVAYDRRNEPSTAVMVPWSEDDDEAASHADQLYRDLEAAFPRNTVRSDELFRPRITTHTDFRNQLAEVLVRAQSRVFRSGEVGRWTGTESWAQRPMMQFPDREGG